MKYIPCEWVETFHDNWVLLCKREELVTVFRGDELWVCIDFPGKGIYRKRRRDLMRLVERRLGVITQE